jgi:hypothetical protein
MTGALVEIAAARDLRMVRTFRVGAEAACTR